MAIARPRLHDRQALRLRDSERLSTLDEALERVRVLLRSGSTSCPGRPVPSYVNGTHEAVRLLEETRSVRAGGCGIL
ncbi:MAG TPA: hypothetical protein VEZ71_13460 [Archangium sp.]|nr:hypothetical protein [Archangium sp.]